MPVIILDSSPFGRVKVLTPKDSMFPGLMTDGWDLAQWQQRPTFTNC